MFGCTLEFDCDVIVSFDSRDKGVNNITLRFVILRNRLLYIINGAYVGDRVGNVIKCNEIEYVSNCNL